MRAAATRGAAGSRGPAQRATIASAQTAIAASGDGCCRTDQTAISAVVSRRSCAFELEGERNAMSLLRVAFRVALLVGLSCPRRRSCRRRNWRGTARRRRRNARRFAAAARRAPRAASPQMPGARRRRLLQPGRSGGKERRGGVGAATEGAVQAVARGGETIGEWQQLGQQARDQFQSAPTELDEEAAAGGTGGGSAWAGKSPPGCRRGTRRRRRCRRRRSAPRPGRARRRAHTTVCSLWSTRR